MNRIFGENLIKKSCNMFLVIALFLIFAKFGISWKVLSLEA